MSILAAINHRITLIASGVAAVVALIALALPSSKSSPASAERAPVAAEGRLAPAMAPAAPLPALDFADATAAIAELPAGDHVHQATPLALPPIEPAGDSVVQTQATTPIPAPIASPNPPPVEEEPAPAASTAPSAVAGSQAALPAGEVNLQLRQLTADQLHARLELAFDRALPRLPDDGTPWLRFPVDTGDNRPVLFAANRQSGELRLVGRPEQLRAWQDIVTALDAPPTADRVTELFAAEKTATPHIKTAAGALAAQVQPVAGQVTVEGQPQSQAAPGTALPPGAAELAMADGQGLLGPVQIEVVEGTDFFIIRGNPRDVERVMKVIEEIEQMSRVSMPEVVVRPLAHVDSQSMALITSRIFSPAAEGSFSLYPYYGAVLAVPLGKPNALLLVGSPTAVGKASELLQKLDIGGGETLTQFETFRLKNAQAEQAQLVVSQLFVENEAEAEGTAPPLAPKALVIAEGRTNSLIVRASPRDMEEIRRMVQEIDAPGGETVNEIRVFRLKNSMAAELAPILQRAVRGAGQGDDAGQTDTRVSQLLKMVTIDAEGQKILASGVLAGVTVNADSRANTLIVSAPPESMSLMATLITQLDVQPDAVAELKVFTIENGDAVSLADMLQGLFGTPDQGGGQGGQGGGGGGGGGAQTAGSRIFQLRFSVDERTNSIIAAGSSDELLVVEAVLLRLDASDSRQRINQVYKLKNADAEQVALALQEWLQQKRDVEATAPGATSPFQQIEREVVIVAEINSNSLIISATPNYFKEIADIIRQVDEEAPIVMIQVLIGEVTLGDIDEFGVEFGLQDSVLFDRSLLENIQTTTNTTTTVSPGGQQNTFQQQIIQSASMTPGFNFGDAGQPLGNSGSDRSLTTAGNVAAQGLSSFGVGRVSQAAGFGGMVLSASSNSISMLLRALQQSQRLEVLSRPQIMALDNQTGRAFVGQIVPYITSSQIDQLGQRTNYVEFRDVGLELLVRPRISPENLVVMEVFAAKSELGAVADGVPISIAPNGAAINAPIINTISAETTISAVSGQTVVLSGLIVKRDRELHRRVPLLADIPLLGDLFRFDSKQVQKAELLIVLTPHVIRSRQQSEMMKQVESARMSWCLSDVVSINGPAGLRSASDTLGAAEAEAVFPTEIPNVDGRFEAVPGEAIVTPGVLPPGAPPITAPQLAP